jgi:protein involved in polysaccharide export with SLBB domain
MNKSLAKVVLLALALAGCSAGRSGTPVGAQAANEEAAIASALSNIEGKGGDYRISPADLLEVTIYGNKDLDRQVRVSQNGSVSFPLIGAVTVGGMSVVDAEKALSDKLKDYLVSPQVTIFIKEYGNKKVFVFGQVAKPGSYDLPTEAKLTVLEAVSMAGGFTPIAAADRTRVIRNVKGKSETFVVQVSAVTKRGQKEKDIPLEPNDVIYVPQSFF